jgi:type IV pilus assembly protein PilN
MIKINLLLREKKKKVGMRKEFVFAIAAILILGALLGLVQWKMASDIESTQKEIAKTKEQIKFYEVQIAKASKAQKEKELLEEKLRVINDLRKQKSSSARVLDEISMQKPEKLQLESMKKEGTKVGIEGIAMDDETVANFMTSLRKSKLFKSVDLIVSEQIEQSKIKLKKFTLSCEITPM